MQDVRAPVKATTVDGGVSIRMGGKSTSGPTKAVLPIGPHSSELSHQTTVRETLHRGAAWVSPSPAAAGRPRRPMEAVLQR